MGCGEWGPDLLSWSPYLSAAGNGANRPTLRWGTKHVLLWAIMRVVGNQGSPRVQG